MRRTQRPVSPLSRKNIIAAAAGGAGGGDIIFESPLPLARARSNSNNSFGLDKEEEDRLIIDSAFDCVQALTEKYNIDESHGLSHSLSVFRFAKEIYASELETHPELYEQKKIIFTAAVLHDMCDKKYMNEQDGVADICAFMRTHSSIDETSLAVIVRIITRMSYSIVKKRGFPDLGEHQLAFHIVREADLLAAYELDRCVVFGMKVNKLRYSASADQARDLYATRIAKYLDDGLFITEYAQKRAADLYARACFSESTM